MTGRDLVRNVIELDTCARAMSTAVPYGDLPVLLWCTFPSESLRWLRAVLRLSGVPEAVIRVIDAIKDGILLSMNIGGVLTIGLVTPGIAQGCPLAGVLFVCVCVCCRSHRAQTARDPRAQQFWDGVQVCSRASRVRCGGPIARQHARVTRASAEFALQSRLGFIRTLVGLRRSDPCVADCDIDAAGDISTFWVFRAAG